MIEIRGNIWEQECNWLCITTNGIIKKDGSAVMGRGIALQAKQRYPGIEKVLAEKIRSRGNVVSSLIKKDGHWLISFPTKHNWKDKSNIDLIKSSAEQLKQHFNNQKEKPIVLIPRPGCFNGRLEWDDVKKTIEPILTDEQFAIITL